MSFVERQFYMTASGANRHDGTLHMRGENRLQLPLKLARKKRLQRRAARRPQIRLAVPKLVFPFAAAERGGTVCRLDGLKVFLAGLPHPERYAVFLEKQFGRVEIGRHKIFVPG